MLGSALFGLRTRRTPPEVIPGAVFRHANAHDTVETAEVIAVDRDETGIAHVRFHVRIRRANLTFADEVRLLSLESFKAHFPEQVAAGT